MSSGPILGYASALELARVPSTHTQLVLKILSSFTRNHSYQLSEIRSIYQQSNVPPGDNGNSSLSLIRSMPFMFLPGFDDIITDTDLTNPNSINRDAGLLYVLALKQTFAGKPATETFDLLQRSAQTAEIRTLLQYIAEGKIIIMTSPSIFTAFFAAIAAFVNSGSERLFKTWIEAIEWVKGLGGDIATNVALAGALIGALFGKHLFDDPKFVELQAMVRQDIYDQIDAVDRELILMQPLSDAGRKLFQIYPLKLKEVKNWADQGRWMLLETNHDFIQILFPTLVSGMANVTLVPSKQDVEVLSKDSNFVHMINDAFNIMMSFYGLEYNRNRLNVIENDVFLKYFAQGGLGKHNHLRITRILTSLNLFRLVPQYLALKELTNLAALQYPQWINSETRNYWQKA